MDTARYLALRMGKGWCGRPHQSTNTIINASVECNAQDGGSVGVSKLQLELFSDKMPREMSAIAKRLTAKENITCSAIRNSVLIFQNISGKIEIPPEVDHSVFIKPGLLGDVVALSPSDKLDFGILMSNSDSNHFVIGQMISGWGALKFINSENFGLRGNLETFSENGVPLPKKVFNTKTVYSETPVYGRMRSFDGNEFKMDENKFSRRFQE